MLGGYIEKFFLAGRHFPEFGNVISNRSGVTRYCFSHVLRAITIKSNNVSFEPRAIAITIGSDSDFHKPRAITIKINYISPEC